MSPEEIRSQFKTFCGPTNYRQFLNAAQVRSSLAFWQKKLWQQFCDRNTSVSSIPETEVVRIFAEICSLHEIPLNMERSVVRPGRVGYSSEYRAARDELFPLGPSDLYDCRIEKIARLHQKLPSMP
jgi:hypothetical protein